mmetsp:Transcript_19346/g.74291  ORF Transcript_19346/g.74291 Transcript_19346/m.74291 type:complete len:269 (-) Transcript_19346:138-944(-)
MSNTNPPSPLTLGELSWPPVPSQGGPFAAYQPETPEEALPKDLTAPSAVEFSPEAEATAAVGDFPLAPHDEREAVVGVVLASPSISYGDRGLRPLYPVRAKPRQSKPGPVPKVEKKDEGRLRVDVATRFHKSKEFVHEVACKHNTCVKLDPKSHQLSFEVGEDDVIHVSLSKTTSSGAGDAIAPSVMLSTSSKKDKKAAFLEREFTISDTVDGRRDENRRVYIYLHASYHPSHKKAVLLVTFRHTNSAGKAILKPFVFKGWVRSRKTD